MHLVVSRRIKAVALLVSAMLLLSSCAMFNPGPDFRVSVEGQVRLQGATTHEGIRVSVRYYDSSERMTIVIGIGSTDSQGRFSISQMPFPHDQVNFKVLATKDGYAPAEESFSIYYGYDGSDFTFPNMLLHNSKKMTVEWAVTNDGTTFGLAAPITQSVVYSYVLNGTQPYTIGFDSSSATLYFYDQQGRETCGYTYSRRIWNMGKMSLASIRSVPDTGGSTWTYVEMLVGNAYVVRTPTGQYAKFRVLSIEEG